MPGLEFVIYSLGFETRAFGHRIYNLAFRVLALRLRVGGH